MKNWKQIEDIWTEFCHKSSLTLHKRERNYIHGKTQYYSTEEVFPDFIITYKHRYEKPDLDVQPEELILTLKSEGFRFKKIEIEKRGLVSRLLNENKFRFKGDFNIPRELEGTLVGLTSKYPTADLKVMDDEIWLKMNEFPKTTQDLNLLADTLKKLSIALKK